MFLYVAERGQKEVKHMVCQGCWGNISEPNLEAGHSTVELVGYRSSYKEIQDIYQSAYLLRRPLGLPSWGDQLRRRTIFDILSSLTDQLLQCRYPAATGEDLESKEVWQPRPNGQEPYEEALRVACQRALDTTKVLWGDIERLGWGMRGTSQTRSRSHSRSHSRSSTRSRRRSRSRSCSRAHSQSHPWSDSWSRQPRSPSRPPPRRRVIFREPEVESNSEGDVEDYLLEPSVPAVETWLDWQACQLGTPAWWSELMAIPGIKDLQKLACKIQASFYIPKARMRTFMEQEYTVPPAPKCLNRNTFLLDELSYQEVQQQLILLTVAYARGMEYWAEKLNPPESPDLCPLAGSVVELGRQCENMSHSPTGMLSGVWGQSAWDPQAGGPKPPCLAVCCHSWPRDRILWKLPPTPLPPLLRRMWLDVPPHHLEQKERTGTSWLLLLQ